MAQIVVKVRHRLLPVSDAKVRGLERQFRLDAKTLRARNPDLGMVVGYIIGRQQFIELVDGDVKAVAALDAAHAAAMNVVQKITRHKPDLSLNELAVGALAADPGMSNKELADRLRCNVKSLSRLPALVTARKAQGRHISGRKRRGRQARPIE